MQAVEARSLSVGYGADAVLTEVDLTLEPGRMVALVGGNGSGKTTLMRTFAGLLPALGGEVAILGRPPGSQPARVSYLGQHHHVNESLAIRVRDVVAMGRYAHLGLLGRFRAADVDLVDSAMSRTKVENLAETPVHDLSGGQRQRVYLAQALAHSGDLYLLDEATAGIDAAGRDTYLRIVGEELERGAAIVVATHDFGEAKRAHDVLLLAKRVVAQGPPTAVLTRENLVETFGVSLTDIAGGGLAHGISHHFHEDHQHDPGHAG